MSVRICVYETKKNIYGIIAYRTLMNFGRWMLSYGRSQKVETG